MNTDQAFRLEIIAGISAAFAIYAKCAESTGGVSADVFADALKQSAETAPTGLRGDSYTKVLLDSIASTIDQMNASGPLPFRVLQGGKDVPE